MLELLAARPFAPRSVSVVHTLRQGDGVYGSGNLALHVGDRATTVARRRVELCAQLGLSRIAYLDQVHGVAVVEAGPGDGEGDATADAIWTRNRGVGCAVLTADCLPVVLADRAGGCVGVAHCGWRGLAGGVLSALIGEMPVTPDALVAHLGPGIGAARYRVGSEVVDAFAGLAADGAQCFRPAQEHGRFYADLEAIARVQLRALGIRQIGGGGFCTARDPRFYSYRRDGVTGRFATIAWLN